MRKTAVISSLISLRIYVARERKESSLAKFSVLTSREVKVRIGRRVHEMKCISLRLIELISSILSSPPGLLSPSSSDLVGGWDGEVEESQLFDCL